MRRRTLAAFLTGWMLLCIGLAVGYKYGYQDAPRSQPVTARPQPVVKVEERKVVVEKTHEVKVPVVPESCIRAADLSKKLVAAVEAYEDAAGRQERLSDESFTAIQMRSIPELNRVIEKQRALRGDLLDPLFQVAEIKKQLDAESAKCNAASK